ncbi:unnamed protein product [Oppiella nova]|uniref:Uncharacterized protein n=1 Tax=Oppiella nova TaxID=334625 RepID=A0A7R9MIU8_9ACAR|nr:unnamed protein product [Oppiella nova]CAG2177202.1 unnamed protein product [Oppiella nova]
MAATKGVHNNPKDLKHYLSVKKEYRNELSVITEENSGVFIEPQRKISSDASSGGRTDTSQLMSTHEEWSQSGIKSPIMEDMNNVCDGDCEMHCKPQDMDHDRGTADANNTVIIIAANNE